MKADEALADEWPGRPRKTQRLRINAEEHQRWDDWAMAFELGVASPPKRRKVAVRVSTAAGAMAGGTVDLGTVPVGQPLRLSLTMASSVPRRLLTQ